MTAHTSTTFQIRGFGDNYRAADQPSTILSKYCSNGMLSKIHITSNKRHTADGHTAAQFAEEIQQKLYVNRTSFC